KAYDRVPREVLKWPFMKKGLPKVYVNINENMYEGVNTRVKTLLVKLRDKITKTAKVEVPWCILCVDDVVLVGESLEEVNYRLEEWREALEIKGLKIYRAGKVVDEIDNYKYLESVLQKNGGFDKDIMHRIYCGWMKWRKELGVLCDRRIPI
ncbi:PREDICTED: uncharacterized protein LOC107172649, partial [Diuraphis noxia]|uniref:uncharacterized protein LOC107172649 n=1 Tax=Diuraphis noxia TaxID=143948 RepID=UPI00076375FD